MENDRCKLAGVDLIDRRGMAALCGVLGDDNWLFRRGMSGGGWLWAARQTWRGATWRAIV